MTERTLKDFVRMMNKKRGELAPWQVQLLDTLAKGRTVISARQTGKRMLVEEIKKCLEEDK